MQPTMPRVAALFSLALVLFALTSPAHAQSPGTGRAVDHKHTVFPLTGAHARLECQDCHVRGVFKGTPTQCQLCHVQGGRVTATSKPATHVPTNDRCDLCHTSTITWVGARFTHSGIAPGGCVQCHNGRTATGKPANHVQTTAACDSCHRTTAWVPAGFNHAGVTPGTCAQCHNGSTATGKPGNHIQTTAACDTCHRTTAWLPATFNHSGVTPGGCAQCHNGSTATGKPTNHVQTTAACDSCHRTTAWLPATFSHATVVPGSCNQCHNGSTATGKPGGHFNTARSCDSCHTTSAWTPARYTHTSPAYSPHASGVTCVGCHRSNTETISWQYGGYAGSCAGGHAGDYKQGSHKKTESPTTIFYTVDELRNCAGSCHQYTDSTFGTILRSRSGEHRSTSGGF